MTRRIDAFGAFCGPPLDIAGAGIGSLAGLTFAAKDLLDVAGHVTGGGNPDWARTHAPATRHAGAVQRLLDQGARLIGKTVSDELAFGLDGENRYFGTPVNPAAPDRLPGGSSSGSAVAVAGRLADVALGTDTGGSVRVPAAFCGLWGIRPSHNAIPLDGVIPFAPSYDTVGWFARDGATLQRVAEALLPPQPSDNGSGRLVLASDLWALADPIMRGALEPMLTRLPIVQRLDVAQGRRGDWLEAYRILQGTEIKASLGQWIAAARPRFGDNIAPRFASLDAIDADQIAWARPVRQALRQRLDEALGADGVLVLPTVHCPAPPKPLATEQAGDFYGRALSLTCLAGHAGRPQVTIPIATTAQGPVGLSLLGARGSDLALIGLAQRLAVISS